MNALEIIEQLKPIATAIDNLRVETQNAAKNPSLLAVANGAVAVATAQLQNHHEANPPAQVAVAAPAPETKG